MLAIDEEDLNASFRQLEEHAQARKKEEEAAAERKRQENLRSTASIRPGSAYTTKSGAVNSAWGNRAGDIILHKKAVCVVGEDDFDVEHLNDNEDEPTKSGSVTSDATRPSSTNKDVHSEEEKDKEEIRSLRKALWEREDEISNLKRELRSALDEIHELKEAQHEKEKTGCFSAVMTRPKVRSVSRAESRKKAV